MNAPVVFGKSFGSNTGPRKVAVTIREYLSFTLGDQLYGVDISRVREIRNTEGLTAIPGSPNFVKGFINLRDSLIPVIDMRVKFGLPAPEYNSFTVMMVLNINDNAAGVVVDTVSDVVRLTDEQIHEPPEFGNGFKALFLRGVATVDQRNLLLVDIDLLVSRTDMVLIEKNLIEPVSSGDMQVA